MPINTAVLTVSDRCYKGERQDISGPALCQKVQDLGWNLVSTAVLPDEIDQIKTYLLNQTSSGKVNLILTSGGTGFSPRDVTPEATLSVIDKRASGIVECIRIESSKTNPHAYLSRAEAGIRNTCLIINLPGSPSGAIESLLIVANIIPHALSLLQQSIDAEDHQVKV